uniref:Uncharacterized protein n=1 Tax=Parascaris univalens TaxID=6257 RepID=A0A915BMR4_PARUN
MFTHHGVSIPYREGDKNLQRPTSQVKSERERRRTDRSVVVCHGDRRTKLAGPPIACRLFRHALKLPIVSQNTSCFLLRCSVFITQRTALQMILLFLDAVQSSHSAGMNFASNSQWLKIGEKCINSSC